jgi:hypothetical protein
MDSPYPFEDNQLIKELARNLNFATPEYPELPEVEGKIDKQAIENVFDLLLKRIILHKEVYIPTKKLAYQQQTLNIFERIAPTLWMKLSAIGAIFFIIAAMTVGLFQPTAIVPIRIYIYLFGVFGLLFAILWEVKWLRQISIKRVFNNPTEFACLAFKKTKEQAIERELTIVQEVSEAASYSKTVLQYVENQIQLELEIQAQNISLTNRAIKVLAIFMVLGFFYTFTPIQILLNTILAGNVPILNSIVTVLTVIGAGLILLTEWLGDTFLQWKIISYKICLNVLRQAQLLAERKQVSVD